MKFAWAIPLFLLLVACRSTPPRPLELVGSWQATELSRGDFHAPLGRPYKLVFNKAAIGENLFDVRLFGCNAQNFVYTVDGMHIENSCGKQRTLSTSTLISCFMRRVNLDGSVSTAEEICTNKLPYCRSRLSRDDQLLISVLRTPSSWHFSHANLVLSSEPANAEVTFHRDDR